MGEAEFCSVESFVQFCLDEDSTSFSHEDLSALNYRLRRPVGEIRRELESWGLSLAVRAPERRVRGFRTSSHDRWFGPGSSPCHGGATYGSMMVQKYGTKDSIFG